MHSVTSNITTLLTSIDKTLVEEIEKDSNTIIEMVLRSFKEHEDLETLTNNHPIHLIKSILTNHILFIRNEFELQDSFAIVEHFIWEFSTYHKVGFPFNFFKYFIKYIIEAFQEQNEKIYQPIIKFYQYILEEYTYLVSNAKTFTNNEITPINESVYKSFFASLLEPSIAKATQVSCDFIKEPKDIKVFWEHIILPSLYNIGAKWANGEISVGQEHTATSICQRVMSFHYSKILNKIENKKNIIVTTSPRELHQVGAVMISDILELNGYEVDYFSSDVQVDEIIATIKQKKVQDIVISTTLISNLDATNRLINDLTKCDSIDNLKFYLGGQAYKSNNKSFKNIESITYINDIEQLLHLLGEEDAK